MWCWPKNLVFLAYRYIIHQWIIYKISLGVRVGGGGIQIKHLLAHVRSFNHKCVLSEKTRKKKPRRRRIGSNTTYSPYVWIGSYNLLLSRQFFVLLQLCISCNKEIDSIRSNWHWTGKFPLWSLLVLKSRVEKNSCTNCPRQV